MKILFVITLKEIIILLPTMSAMSNMSNESVLSSNNSDNQYSHIYAFVKKKKDAPINERIFYVGSSKVIHERVTQHLNTAYKSLELARPIEVYGYINKIIGVDKFDIYIIDHVPPHMEKAYERIYYDLLISQGCDLKNSNKPIPEYDHNVIKDMNVIAPCGLKLMSFYQRVLITPEEHLINQLKKQVIEKQNIVYKNQLKLENDRLKKMNRELRQQNENVSNELIELKNKYKSNEDLNTLLRKQIDLHEKLQKESVTTISPLNHSLQQPVDLNVAKTPKKNTPPKMSTNNKGSQNTISTCNKKNDSSILKNNIDLKNTAFGVIISDRFQCNNILAKFNNVACFKIVLINNYSHALPRLPPHVSMNDDHKYLDDMHSTLYVRIHNLGGRADSHGKDIGFYENILQILKNVKVTSFIYISDTWPPPKPRSLLANDYEYSDCILKMASNIFININDTKYNHLKNDKTYTKATHDITKFKDVTNVFHINPIIERRPIKSTLQHQIIHSLLTHGKMITADKLHDLVSPQINKNVNICGVRHGLCKLYDKGYISREKSEHTFSMYENNANTKYKVFKYYMSDNNFKNYVDMHPNIDMNFVYSQQNTK